MSDFLRIITELKLFPLLEGKTSDELIIDFPLHHSQIYENKEIYETPIQNSPAAPENYSPPSALFPDEEINEYLASKIRLLHEKNQSTYYKKYFDNLIDRNRNNELLIFKINFCAAHWNLYSRDKVTRRRGFKFIIDNYFEYYKGIGNIDLKEKRDNFIHDFWFNIEGLGISQSFNGGPTYTTPSNVDMAQSWIYMDSIHSVNKERLFEEALILLHESQTRYEHAIPLIYRNIALSWDTYDFLKNSNIIQ